MGAAGIWTCLFESIGSKKIHWLEQGLLKNQQVTPPGMNIHHVSVSALRNSRTVKGESSYPNLGWNLVYEVELSHFYGLLDCSEVVLEVQISVFWKNRKGIGNQGYIFLHDFLLSSCDT